MRHDVRLRWRQRKLECFLRQKDDDNLEGASFLEAHMVGELYFCFVRASTFDKNF
jgi:hypothetical protein